MNKSELFKELKNVDNESEIRYWILDNLFNDGELKSYLLNYRGGLNE
jgi:hypothetical protein